MTRCEYGARVERGTIDTVSGDTCTVSIYDRYGLTCTCRMPYGCVTGDSVLLVMFDDGEAYIIQKL